MRLEGTGKLLRIFVGEKDRWRSQPLYVAIVEALRRQGFGGATVIKGIEGFGAHSVVHAARVVDFSSDLPVLIEVVESDEKIRAFLPTIDEMVKEGLVTLESVEIIHYRAGEPKPR